MKESKQTLTAAAASRSEEQHKSPAFNLARGRYSKQKEFLSSLYFVNNAHFG